MAYRFLDTSYFRSPFVRGLEAPLKSLYSYIITDCSGAGIWTADIPIASIYIGIQLDENRVREVFIDSGKAVDLLNGKWFFPDFIQHQHPKGLSEKNPAHSNIILELKKYNLIDENLRVLEAPRKGLKGPSKGTKVMVMGKDKVMEEDMVMDKEKVKEKKSENFVFQNCMKIYSDFIQKKTGVKAKITGADGKAMKDIISYLTSIVTDKADPKGVENALEYIFTNWEKAEPFLRNQLKLIQINSNLINIINQIKNGQSKPTNKAEQVSQHNRDQLRRILDGTL